MATGVAGLLELIIEKILTGGRRTTAAKTREVLNEVVGSNLNKVDGGVVEGPVEFQDQVIITDDEGAYRWRIKVTSTGVVYAEQI